MRVTIPGDLSARSNALLQESVREVVEEFDALAEEDNRLAHEVRAGTTIDGDPALAVGHVRRAQERRMTDCWLSNAVAIVAEMPGQD